MSLPSFALSFIHLEVCIGWVKPYSDLKKYFSENSSFVDLLNKCIKNQNLKKNSFVESICKLLRILF